MKPISARIPMKATVGRSRANGSGSVPVPQGWLRKCPVTGSTFITSAKLIPFLYRFKYYLFSSSQVCFLQSSENKIIACEGGKALGCERIQDRIHLPTQLIQGCSS